MRTPEQIQKQIIARAEQIEKEKQLQVIELTRPKCSTCRWMRSTDRDASGPYGCIQPLVRGNNKIYKGDWNIKHWDNGGNPSLCGKERIFYEPRRFIDKAQNARYHSGVAIPSFILGIFFFVFLVTFIVVSL